MGVAVAAIMMLVLIWLYLRRRRWRQQGKRKNSHDPRDAEKAKTAGADVRAYRASALSELSGGGDLGADDKTRRYSELASPIVAQEVYGDREFAAELQGSAVPMNTGHKEVSRWPPGAPNYSAEHAEPRVEKKSGARLFDDAPIDETDIIIDVDDHPRTADKKEGFLSTSGGVEKT